MTKELALEEGWRERSAVHLDERARRTTAMPMDCACEALLARPRLTVDEHRGLRGRHRLDLAKRVAKDGALPEDVVDDCSREAEVGAVDLTERSIGTSWGACISDASGANAPRAVEDTEIMGSPS